MKNQQPKNRIWLFIFAGILICLLILGAIAWVALGVMNADSPVQGSAPSIVEKCEIFDYDGNGQSDNIYCPSVGWVELAGGSDPNP